VLESTFQLASGIGPAREQCLWKAGIAVWSDFRQTKDAVLPGRAGQLLRSAIEAAADALTRGDADRLASLLPAGEHWRMLPAFGDGVLYLDIETGDDDVRFEGISAIGMLDRHGPRLLLGGRDLQCFPEAAHGASMLVTFNGLSFDVPILRRAFPDWRPPVCHVDLRPCRGAKATRHPSRPSRPLGRDGRLGCLVALAPRQGRRSGGSAPVR